MNFLFHLFLLLGLLAKSVASEEKPQCYARFYFARLCHHFAFDGECQPWKLADCEAFRITHNELRCPTFFCVSLVYCEQGLK